MTELIALPSMKSRLEHEEYHDGCNEVINLHDRDEATHNVLPSAAGDDLNPLIISIDDAIDRIGTGRFQTQIMIAAGLCFASDAMEILLLSFLSLVLMSEWDLTNQQASSITASVFAGAFVGTLILGRLGDKWGRRPVFLLTASMIACFGMGTALVQTFHQLIFFRAMVGFGVGGIVVPFDALAEFMPTQSLGKRLIITSYFWTTATLLVPIFAYATLGQVPAKVPGGEDDMDNSWRIFVGCCAAPCAVAAIFGLYVVPESPRWMLLQGKSEAALNVLRQAAATNGKDATVLFPSGSKLQCPRQEAQNTTFCDMLSPGQLRTTLLLWCLWFLYAFMYYGTVLAISLVFSNTQHTNINNESSNLRYSFDYFAIIASSSAEIAGVTWVLLTVDRFGRIHCMSIYFFLGGVFMLTLCMLEEVAESGQGKEYRSALIVLAFFSRMFVYSGSSIVWITTAELLETKIRATGHSAANAAARIGAFLAPYLVSSGENPATIGARMFVASLLIVGCARCLPETAGLPLDMNRMIHRIEQASRIRVPTEENGVV